VIRIGLRQIVHQIVTPPDGDSVLRNSYQYTAETGKQIAHWQINHSFHSLCWKTYHSKDSNVEFWFHAKEMLRSNIRDVIVINQWEGDHDVIVKFYESLLIAAGGPGWWALRWDYKHLKDLEISSLRITEKK